MASITSRPPPGVSPSAASTSVSALSASTIPTSVESTQDNDPPTMRFTTAKDLFDVINSTTGDFLTVTSVSPIDFTKIERAREKQGRRFRFRDYDSNSQILIITIPTDLHEKLHKLLYDEFVGQVRDMGLKKSWNNIGNATRSTQGHSGRSSKEGDSTGGPKPQRATKGAWPTLVIEAGFSQSLGKLHIVMQRWFSMSNHEVKIVLLTKFNGAIILLEKWEEEIQVRPGATTTRHSLQHPASVLRQSITITRNSTTNPTSYNVTSGALVLSFQILFLRDPGPGEGDFIFSVRELEEYAEEVWAQV
ncbi:hypothetical protein B0H67DRAFT_75807 [Lasiosphaeris hirsuta]|uniref:Uncharacterized protein n=1 Tax=Lasiosphaeris hirsuta TaxID=260670 RepID=A0AA40BC23_9PEZI|nr:hypothetical protein B0H67DRAFT_75807 [Lasiosphaeris hirsuta]